MKVLMINSVCGIRSTGRICTDIATVLENQGHVVKIAYGREVVPEQFQKYAERIGSDFDVKIHGVFARIFDASGFGSKRATKKFIEWVEQYDPDVIHLHNLHGYYINLDVLFDYLHECGKRILWTLHDCWAFTGHSAYCDAVGCERWKNICNHCPNLKMYPISYLDRSKNNWKRKKKLFTGIQDLMIITPSYWLANLVKKSFLSDYSVNVIHNGIDTSQFYSVKSDFREHFGIENKYILLGVSTSWDDMKGLSDFIHLAERLDDGFQIVLVGITAEQKRKLPSNILGIERTNNIEELTQIYSVADLFLNLSYCENYPTVNLEAIACGTPILTYKTGGSVESAEKYEGIVVGRGNLDEAIKKIYKYREAHYNKPILDIKLDDIDMKTAARKYLEIIEKISF